MIKKYCLFILLFLQASQGFAQDKFFITSEGLDPVYEQLKKHWTDSVFNNMSMDERLGQLFMVAAYSNKDEAHLKNLEMLVEEEHIGGLIFFQGGPIRQAKMTNILQSKAKVPLWIAMDAEWGLGMRLDSTISFPRQLTLGAIRQNNKIYRMGREIARQCRRLGVHINFAPVVDINNNPKNPVINNRSFGEGKSNVAFKGLAYTEGLQDGNVMACAKHFPGHGDTDSDSHLTLPVIKQSRERLEELELHPFRILINNGVQSIMAAHIHVPALDSTFNLATSLSPKVLKQLLREEMEFDGLVFSDALNMKGVSKFFEPGEVDLKAFLAGNDVLLFAEDVPKAKAMFKAALDNGKLDPESLKESVMKILEAKFDLGLTKKQEVELEGLHKDLNNPRANYILQELYESSLVLAANDKSLLPISGKDSFNIASLSIGVNQQNAFQDQLSMFAPVQHFQSSKSPSIQLINKLS
ncbi:MAG: glycoside hydrolase family 3 N-terminal domain-containing protein, partial [Chitinophagales bacterium]